jgi:hypothetical protein
LQGIVEYSRVVHGYGYTFPEQYPLKVWLQTRKNHIR